MYFYLPSKAECGKCFIFNIIMYINVECMKRFLLIIFLLAFYCSSAQITLDYETQTGSFNATRTVNVVNGYFAGSFNSGPSEVGTYANGSGGGYIGDPGVALFRTLTTAANANSGTARAMQVGDEFSITCYVGNSSSFFNNSSAGISFNGGTSSGAFGNYNTLQRAKFQISQNGNWFPAASATGLGYATPGQDVTFKIKLTSAKTVNMTISSANGATTYDMALANAPDTSNNIQNFVIWNQTSGSGNDMYWKNASLKSTGSVEIGGNNGSSTFDGAITDGYLPNSNSILNANSVTKSGTGTITFSANNTYTGNTRITGGTIRLSGAGTLGVGSNVYISSGASLDLNSVNATVASVQETGSNIGGTVALGSGTLTISGGWSGTTYQNSISGTGGLVKHGSGTLSLYGTQSYTGSTTVTGGELSTAVAMGSSSYTINGGTLTLGAANIIPDAATVSISSGAFNVGFDETISNLTITGGTVSVAAGKILTINGNLTLSTLSSITLGAGAAIRYGSNGTLIYNLTGSATTADTEWPASFGPASVTISGGTVQLHADRAIAGNLTVNAGTLDLAQHTISRSTAGGVLTIADGASLKIGGTGTIPANFATHSISSGSTIEYNGTDQVIAQLNSASYGTLIVSGTGTKTLSGNIGVAGNLTINSAELNLGSSTINRTAFGGTFTLAGGATLKVGGTGTFPSGYATHAIGSTSTVEYNGAIQTVAVLNSSQAYGHLILSGTGDKTLGGNIVTEGNLTVNDVLLAVAGGQNLRVNGNVINNEGTITFENNANLLQGTATTTNANTGNIILNRDSSALYRHDYTMWSSPVAGQNLFGFSPATLAERFYTYNTGTNQFNVVPGLGAASTTVFGTGTGYLIRMPNTSFTGNNIPTGTTADAAGYQLGTATMMFNGQFTGVPNNGNITVPLTTSADGYNLIGNPYPSPVSISAFMSANSNAIEGTLWIWRKTNSSANSAYVTVNSAGIYAGNGAPEQEDPNGIIRTGQGFIVKLKSGYTSDSILFTNSMRSGDTANQFFRMEGQDEFPESHGIWLNLTGSNGIFSQMYTGYIAGATSGQDAGIDSRYINDKPVVLAALIDNEEFVIQGRALPFEADDVVPLQLRTGTAGNYTISIDHVNGLFAQGQPVYLKDNLAGMVHNLTEGGYSFATEAGTFSNRFEVVFAAPALSSQHNYAESNEIVVYKENSSIIINAGKSAINKVTVHDLGGRLLYSGNVDDQPLVKLQNLNVQQQVVLVRITTEKGTTSKKIIY